MGKTKESKVNKTSKKIPGDIVAIILVLALIGAYIFYGCYSALNVDVETITAVKSTVYETIDAQALVIRDEHTVSGSSSGVTVASVNNGEKVKAGGNIAMVFSSEEDATKYSSAQELQSQLSYYEELETQASGTVTDVEQIDSDILSDVNSYIRAVGNGRYDSLLEYSDDLNERFIRRQLTIGEKIDFSQVKSDIKNQLDEINVSTCSPVDYLTTEESGIFSSYTDGFESIVDYSKATEIDAATLKSCIEKVSASENDSSSFGKLITSYEWYFCCVVPSKDTVKISDGDTLNVTLKSSDDILKCQVISGADPDLNTEETVLVLRCSDMNSRIASMRLEDIEIRYSEYEGFKIPASAVHVDDNGEKFVYALISNTVEKRSGEIIYSTKDYVVFGYDAQNSDSIRYYDQIITKGTDLHDGKVYS
ncbi:MAG TPA: hypothetical protein IAA24_01470 [Candidatus Eubacterium faecigallinarum]|nr:hypothetical protein [Candidatus Eubacterium faecigallinarum]